MKRSVPKTSIGARKFADGIDVSEGGRNGDV
jgi:hypothetical protein